MHRAKKGRASILHWQRKRAKARYFSLTLANNLKKDSSSGGASLEPKECDFREQRRRRRSNILESSSKIGRRKAHVPKIRRWNDELVFIFRRIIWSSERWCDDMFQLFSFVSVSDRGKGGEDLDREERKRRRKPQFSIFIYLFIGICNQIN